MSKAILISIKPKWCELIANDEKTIEVRKTLPQLKPPFKCYIYCTKEREKLNICNIFCDVYEANGTVFGEFVCDNITEYQPSFSFSPVELCFSLRVSGCLEAHEVWKYADGKTIYGWHISKLKIYDEPKSIGDFTPCCDFMLDEKQCDYRKVECLHQQDSFLEEDGCNCLNFVNRPPQSFCYVEELT